MTTTTTHGDKTRTQGNKYNLTPETARVGVQIGKVTSEALHSVSKHILKMSRLHNRLSQLGVNLPDDAVVDRILQSLPPSYKSFVMNFNMQGMDVGNMP